VLATSPAPFKTFAARWGESFFLGPAHRAERRRQIRLFSILVAAAVVGKLLLANVANIEPILAVSLIGGMVLRRAYVLLVPIVALCLHEVLVTMLFYPGYGAVRILALSVFLVTGWLLVSLAGTRVRSRVLFRTKTIAIATAVSVPLTVAWDVWTAFGNWLTISRYPPYNWSLPVVLEMQVPFTLVHVISSLLFVPLIGFGMGYYVEHVLAAEEPTASPASQEGLDLGTETA